MKSFESAQAVASDIDPRYMELIDGPPSSDYNKRQIQLAVEKFRTEQPWEHLDHAKLQEVLLTWGGSSEPNGDSKVFARIARDPGFKDHPKFRGDVANITLEDMYQ